MIPNLSPARPAPALLPLQLADAMGRRLADDYAEALATLSEATAAASGLPGLEAVWASARRLRAEAELQEALRPPRGDPAELADHLERICAALARAALAGTDLRLAVHADRASRPAEVCWGLGMIVAEFVRAAARRRLRSSGSLAVRLHAADIELTCLLCDNRAPRPGSDNEWKAPLADAIAAQSGAVLDTWRTPRGAAVRIRLPGVVGSPALRARPHVVAVRVADT